YFHYLNGGDRVAIKPHASPAYHAAQYLLGNLDRAYLTTLRSFHGLQAYPSRTKDPDRVDFSTGSVGLGAVAPAFAALADRYADLHFGPGPRRRFVALVGDAELDEGNVWEAVAEEALRGLGTSSGSSTSTGRASTASCRASARGSWRRSSPRAAGR